MPRTMRTFFDVNAEHPDEFILLDVSESHHLTKVLRLTEGDEVEALDGQGGKYKTKIASIEGKSVKLQIVEKEFSNTRHFLLKVYVHHRYRYYDSFLWQQYAFEEFLQIYIY